MSRCVWPLEFFVPDQKVSNMVLSGVFNWVCADAGKNDAGTV